MKLRVVLITLLLLAPLTPSISATPPKAGAICSKAGITKSYNGKKFTCVKSGKKLTWNKGVAIKPTPNPTPSVTQSPSPTPTPSPSVTQSPSPSPTATKEATDSYITASRSRGNSGNARALSTNSAVVLREDATSGSKSYRVKIISPQKDGVSFDSGLIKDYAENISFFVEGTICYVIYASEFISYRDLEGRELHTNSRMAEAPRAEFSDCPTSVFRGVPIVPGPITIPKQGVQEIYSDVTPDNGLRLRVKGKNFKSYQVILESSLNSNILWTSKITDSVGESFTENIGKLACDVRYAVRVKLWSESQGMGSLITNVRAHNFTSLPCQAPDVLSSADQKPGANCAQVGRQINTSTGYLECRRILGDKNSWTLVEQKLLVTPYSGPKESIDICKLRDYRSTKEGQLPNHSFPRPDNNSRIKSATGTVDIALVGIDFSDAPGLGKPFDQEPMLQKNFDQWVDFWSAGKLKWKWHELNEWTRVSSLSTEFNQKRSNTADQLMATEVFTEINKKMSLKDIEIVLIYFPETLLGTDDGYMPFKGQSAELSFGTFSPYYWGGDPSVNELGPQNKSWYYYHEVLHGIGFSLHAPGNAFLLGPTNIEVQNGRDFGYGSPAYIDMWSGFVNGWYDEKNIICIDKSNLKMTEVQLESIDINPKGQTSVMVKLSEKEILVIESRRSGPYTNLPKGLAGITVTRVDTSKLYSRFDRSVDGFEWEKNQWAYYARVDQEKSPEWFVRPDTPSRILGYEGETFTIDGIKILVKKSGTFDTIEIWRQ